LAELSVNLTRGHGSLLLDLMILPGHRPTGNYPSGTPSRNRLKWL
jgi:hypothetical protein